MRIKLFVVVVVSLILSGCSSTEIVDRFPVQGTMVHTVDRTVPGRTVSTEELRYSAEAAKYKLQLAKLEAKVRIAEAEASADAEKARVRAENPCSSWFMTPSFCYTNGVYNGGGYVVSGITSSSGIRQHHNNGRINLPKPPKLPGLPSLPGTGKTGGAK